MGGNALRVIISRQRVQKGSGYDFSTFDNIVNEARKRGIAPQIVLDNLEGFKTHGAGSAAKYEKFVRAAAQHFKGRVGMYSISNEPDLKMAPKKYRELFVRGSRALNQTDPQARVLFGEVSPHGGIDYAKKVIGNRPLTASGFAIHPYQVNNPNDAPQGGGWSWGIGKANTMQRELKTMGLKTRAGHTPGLYFSEFGYQNDNPNAARFWPQAIAKARKAGVKELVAYTVTGSPGQNWDSGLVNPNGWPRDSYIAIQKTLRP